MPLMTGRDKFGPYYRWGPASKRGKKYHYISGNVISRNMAKEKALLQGRAIFASKRRQKRTN